MPVDAIKQALGSVDALSEDLKVRKAVDLLHTTTLHNKITRRDFNRALFYKYTKYIYRNFR